MSTRSLGKVALLSATVSLLSGCFNADVGQIEFKQNIKTVDFEFNGEMINSLSFDVGFGSGAFHHPEDDDSIFYTISDRGPNIKCSDSEKILGVANFCGDDSAGKIFPVPEFTPVINKLQVYKHPLTGKLSYKILKTTPLLDSDGVAISGITNPLTVTDTESSYDHKAQPIAFDAQGLDTEALVKLNDGSFWLSEEYGPSLVRVAADGRIMARHVPASMAGDLSSANYPIIADLPEVLKKRKLNRGIESIAVSPDNKFLYFSLQSPLANPDKAAYSNSRAVRIFKMALNEDGSLGQAMGEFVYRLDTPMTFADKANGVGDLKNGDYRKQSDVKISEMTAVGNDELVVLERISKVTKLYRINFDGASNILATAHDDIEQSPSLEQQAIASDVKFINKQLAFNSMDYDFPDGIDGLAKKIEGIAILDENHVALINDNDFGIEGNPTQVTILPIAEQLNANVKAQPQLDLANAGRYETGLFDESAAEINAYDANRKQLLVVNANAKSVDVLSLANPAQPVKVASLDLSLAAQDANLAIGAANSIAIHNDTLAVAIENDNKQANGIIAFYNLADMSLITTLGTGALPDMVTFSPDGQFVLAANEGEPNDDYSVDPEGSITLIDLANGLTNAQVSQLDFKAFNQGGERHSELDSDVRVFSPGASVAQDLEPEYISVSKDGKTAYVALQENNAMAIVDLASKRIQTIKSFGFKDHGKAGNGMDVSNKDDAINIRTWSNVYGMYQPDAIATYQANGKSYLVTANEGDSRDYDAFSEEERVKDLLLNPEVFSAELQESEQLGRLKITTTLGQNPDTGEYDKLYSYGTRSFSIWDQAGNLVFDSGDDFEQITATALGVNFNSTNDENDSGDNRSDDKGPEPEAVSIGEIDGRQYAFIGLERVGGIVVYDISSPYAPQFVEYINNRNFDPELDVEENLSQAGDLGPEGISFFKQDGRDFIAVSNEVSGTTSVIPVK